MMKKGYARGGMKKKGYAAGGVGMKKKMMSRGGKMPMATDPKTGKKVPAFAMDGVGKMAKGGNMKKKMMSAGGTMKKKMMSAGGNMKKKMYASRGTDVSSDYTSGSITKRKYPGAGVRAKDESKDKAVTPAMIKKAGITGGNAKQRLNAYMNKFKMEGGKYVKRKRILRSSDPKVNEMLGLSVKGKDSKKPTFLQRLGIGKNKDATISKGKDIKASLEKERKDRLARVRKLRGM